MENSTISRDGLNPVTRLSRDLAKGAVTLGDDEARFLVDEYYAMQEQRKRSANQVRALSESQEPHEILQWFNAQSEQLEQQVKRALGKYAEAHPVGQWAMSVRGIGPVITAGLLAHIDINKAPTVGHIWRFAGLDPTSEWKRGERRPWNANLKTLCWKIGESFVKTKGHEEAFYGKLYDERRILEDTKNNAGLFKEQAAKVLERSPKHAQRKTYEAGKLPDGHLHSRAKRYVVKLFLAHLHDVWYRHEFGKAPPVPYPIAHLGHAHMIDPPNR